jgi:xanthine dehydrogenase accessory factor
MKTDTLSALLAARRIAQPICIATRLSDGKEMVIDPAVSPKTALAEVAVRAAGLDQSAPVEIDDEKWFINVFNPPPRLIIAGAVHIAQPLSQMVKVLGWRVVVADPRSGFSSEARFPDIQLVHDWPDEAVRKLNPDSRTAVVTLTHDPKLDDPALHAALQSSAFFIGCLGSRKTHAARLDRLRLAGFDEESLRRIRGPVGLPINAMTPAEIAVSILGQIIETLRAGRR